MLFFLGFGSLAAGVLIGRYYVPDDRELKRSAGHAKAYMEAINFLLARDRNAAVDKLRTVVEQNVTDIEPYFALGALFRSRGEWERAVRVHQAIDLREGASKKVRLRARYELGLDFRGAGMPRRATRAMEDVLSEQNKHAGAIRALCGLYEEQGRYTEASSAWARLHKVEGGELNDREHHLMVAGAQRAIESGDYDSAKRLLRDAEKMDDESPHLLVAAAELAAAKNNPGGASARLRQALSVAPDLAAFLVPGLVAAERQKLLVGGKSDDEELSAEGEAAAIEQAVVALQEVLESTGDNPHLQLAVAELRSNYDPTRALDDYRTVAALSPDSLPARVEAARLALGTGVGDEIATELSALVGTEGALSWVTDGSWRCTRCGFRTDTFFWRCDDCRHWAAPRLDVGREAQDLPASQIRERRELPRGGSQVALLGAADQVLPVPALESGMTSDELTESGARRSVLGRMGSWFRRGSEKKQ